MPNIYLVGGVVRDKYLGIPPSGDIDFAVEASSFEEMQDYLTSQLLAEIKVTRPQYVQLRAKVDRSRLGEFGQMLPNKSLSSDPAMQSLYADFTLCRSDGCYSDTRRPDTVSVGTLDQDLARRDFTCNAIAVSEDGTIYDPHGGIDDIKHRWITTVGAANDRLREDALRILRAMRFYVTKEMRLEQAVADAMHDNCLLLKTLPVERISEELGKMFKHNTRASIAILQVFPTISAILFNKDNLWLQPTTRKKGSKDGIQDQNTRDGQGSLQEGEIQK